MLPMLSLVIVVGVIHIVPPCRATILLVTKLRPCLGSVGQIILPRSESPSLSPIIASVSTTSTTTSSSSEHELSGRPTGGIHLHPSYLTIAGGTGIPRRGETVSLPQLAGGLVDARQT